MVVRAEARKIGVLPGYTEILDEDADLDVLVLAYSITRRAAMLLHRKI